MMSRARMGQLWPPVACHTGGRVPRRSALSSRSAPLRRCVRAFRNLASASSKRLARFDFVVASVHGRFRLDSEAQTKSILQAVANPYTTILGHMTGRQL